MLHLLRNSLEYAMNWRRDKAMVLLAVDRHQAGGGDGTGPGKMRCKGCVLCVLVRLWTGSRRSADA